MMFEFFEPAKVRIFFYIAHFFSSPLVLQWSQAETGRIIILRSFGKKRNFAG